MSTIRVDRITPYQSGSVAIEGLNITNLTIDGTLTASLQQGYVWVGGSGNVSTLAPTSSFGGGGGGSDITALNSFTSSQQVLNATFATTESNTFRGAQEVIGSINIVDGRFSVTSGSGDLTSSLAFTHNTISSTQGYSLFTLRHINNDFNENFALKLFADDYIAKMQYEKDGSTIDILQTNLAGDLLLTQDTRLFQKSLNIDNNLTITGSLSSSGSANFEGDVTASIFTGSFIGDGSGLTGIGINTGSFATTGSNTFVGNQVISGSLTISGSSTFRNIGPTILSGSVDISGSINSDGYELEASSTIVVPTLNSTFNLNLSSSSTPLVTKVLPLGDGKILVAGKFESIDGHATAKIGRLNSDGTVDTSFTAQIGNSDFYQVSSFVTQSDNKIIVVGQFNTIDGNGVKSIGRLNANGSHDTTFTNASGYNVGGNLLDVIVQNDNKITVVGGFAGQKILRFNTDGTVDSSLSVPFATSSNVFGTIALQTTNSIDYLLVGGYFQSFDTASDFKLFARLDISGALDTTFAGSNLLISSGGIDQINKIKLDSNNDIYIAGRFTGGVGFTQHANIARISTEDNGDGRGAFDSSFAAYTNGAVYDFDFYDNDKILIGGEFTQAGVYASQQSRNKFAVIRRDNGNITSSYSFSDYNLNDTVLTVAKVPSTTNALLGGYFTQINSTSRDNLASVKLSEFGTISSSADYSITADTNELLISSSNTRFSGDVNISGNVTASIQEGYVLVGGAGDVSKLTPTSSFGGGGDVFPYTGNAVISGSITISGSILQTGVGENNIFIGSGSGASNTSGPYNTFVGVMGGNDNTTGDGNTFIGASAGLANTTGGANTFVGAFSAIANTTGANNSVLGVYAAESNTTGYNNIFIGNYAGGLNTTGFSNTFLGYGAGNGNITGNYNVAIGDGAGSAQAANLTSIFIGAGAQPQSNLQSNQIVIGYNATGNGTNTTTIGNSSTTATYLRGALNLTHRTSPHIMSGSLNMSGSINVTSAVTASSFTGSFIGDGSGLTGITSTLPSDILSSSVTNFTDYSQSVDTRISSIVTGTGFATTGSNTFVGNQIVTGSLTLSSSAAVDLRVVGDSVLSGSLTVTGSITVPGSGSLVNFVANPSTMRSIRGNGAGLYNIVEQSDGNVAFTLTRIGTGELTAAITSNISGSTINGSFSDNTTTTSGAGRGARLRGFISGGVVTSVQIDTSNSSLGYEEYGQPASRQGIGYKAGDTLTINQSLNQASGSLTITLRQQDIDTYFGIDPRVSFDYKQYGILTARAGIISSGSISVGAGVNTLGAINGNNIAAGTDVNVTSDYSIAVGQDLYNDYINAYANATFGLHHSSSNYAQTIVGIASRLDDAGPGAFVVGNGTTSIIGEGSLTRSNLLVAQGSTVQVTGSLDVSGNGYVILSKVSASYNYADDTAAQAGGVPLGGLYHTSGSVKIRLV